MRKGKRCKRESGRGGYIEINPTHIRTHLFRVWVPGFSGDSVEGPPPNGEVPAARTSLDERTRNVCLRGLLDRIQVSDVPEKEKDCTYRYIHSFMGHSFLLAAIITLGGKKALVSASRQTFVRQCTVASQ